MDRSNLSDNNKLLVTSTMGYSVSLPVVFRLWR